MTTTKWLAAAALATATIATPALAQDRMSGDMTRAEMKAQARQDRAAQRDEMKSDRMAQRDRSDVSDRRGVTNNNGYWRQSNTGFWPGDVAANVVDGAVVTAGAIAAAPFGGYNNSYASYDNGWDRSWNNGWSYSDSNAALLDDDSFDTGPRNRVQARANRPGSTPTNNGSNAITGSASYAERNGFVCTPGTVFTTQNGNQTLCQ